LGGMPGRGKRAAGGGGAGRPIEMRSRSGDVRLNRQRGVTRKRREARRSLFLGIERTGVCVIVHHQLSVPEPPHRGRPARGKARVQA